MATLITKNSSTASSIPTAAQLVQGELAVNVTDKRLFTENSAGAVVELGTNPSSITTGTLTASGNVGIGTSSPLAKTNVSDSNSNLPLFVQGGSAATAGDGGGIAFSVANGSGINSPTKAAAAIRSLNTFAGEPNGQEVPLAFYTH